MSVRPPSRTRRSNLMTAAGLLATLQIVGACAGRQRGATPENLAMAGSAVPDGADLFKRHCAGCHGQRGEGLGRAPRILGRGALPEYPAEQNLNADPAAGDPELLRLRAQTRPAGAPSRDPFRSAEDLFQFVSKYMPRAPEQPGSLRPEEYWAIINFMLVAHGIAVPPGGVSPQNASAVKL